MASSKEAWKVEKGVFDQFTIQNLRKLEAEGFLEIDHLSPLFIGKESHVFTSPSKQGVVIVKIYRLENADFLKMWSYLQGDTRIDKLRRSRREIIFTWVRREYKNLLRAREGKVRSPLPLAVKQNILVMELIGSPANKLKDAYPKSPEKFYELLIKELKKLVKANLAHGDLSQFNVLNFEEKPVLIDFSQSMPLDSPHAVDFFKRDIQNLNTFFKKLGLKEKELKSFDDLL